MNRIATQAKLDATSRLLALLAQDYYRGCKAYHVLTAQRSPDRAHWHVRLKTMAQLGNALADALIQPRPNWPALFHIADRFRTVPGDPFQPRTSAAFTDGVRL
jgi:hypothetical protein